MGKVEKARQQVVYCNYSPSTVPCVFLTAIEVIMNGEGIICILIQNAAYISHKTLLIAPEGNVKTAYITHQSFSETEAFKNIHVYSEICRP